MTIKVNCNIYELQSINDNLKQLKEDAKEAGYDAGMLAKVAKAMSESKVDEILEKNEIFSEFVDEVRNSGRKAPKGLSMKG